MPHAIATHTKYVMPTIHIAFMLSGLLDSVGAYVGMAVGMDGEMLVGATVLSQHER